MADSSASPDQSTSIDTTANAATTASQGASSTVANSLTGLIENIETFLDNLWSWNNVTMPAELVEPHLDAFTEAIESWSQIPSPLTSMAQAMDRGKFIAIGIGQGVKERRMHLKPVAQDLDAILENMKTATYGDGEGGGGGDDVGENDEEVDGEADGEVAKEELTFRLLENIIFGLQGLL